MRRYRKKADSKDLSPVQEQRNNVYYRPKLQINE